MVHGTSHHLGLDVHDCAQAKRELYLAQVLPSVRERLAELLRERSLRRGDFVLAEGIDHITHGGYGATLEFPTPEQPGDLFAQAVVSPVDSIHSFLVKK